MGGPVPRFQPARRCVSAGKGFAPERVLLVLALLLFNASAARAVKTLSISAASLSFGDQPVGTQSASQTVVITNTGDEDVIVSSVLPTGGNGIGDFLGNQNCSGSPLAPGTSCHITVIFAPLAPGPRNTALVATTDADVGTISIALSGNGTPPPAPAIGVNPPSLSFSSQTVGTTSPAQSVTVTNTGTAPLVISSVTVNPGGEFAASGGGGTIAPNGSQAISITFTPSATGPRGATLSIATNAPGSPSTVSLSGTGAPPPAPGASLSPTSLDFGSQVINTTSPAQSFTLTNTGTAPLHVASMTLTGADAGDFTFTAGNGPGALAPNASQTITLSFTPSATGSRHAAVSISDDAPGSPHTVTLTGSGTPVPAPAISVSPPSLSFSSQAAGTTSPAKNLTLTNTGTAPLVISSVSVSPGGEFSTSGGGGMIAPNASQTVSVTFTPAASGPRSATLSIASNAPGGTATVSLSGTGSPPPAPGISLTPSTLDFGSQTIDTAGPAQSFTITNTGTAPLNIISIALAGLNPGDYAITAGGAPGSLAPTASQTITLTFTPTATGSRTAAVSIVDDAPGSPHTVALTGTGAVLMTPAVSISPASLDFGSQRVKTTSAQQSVTLTNIGSAPLVISSITLSGTNKSNFAFTAGSSPATLAPNASQTVSLTFTPSTTGSRTATVSIADNAAGSPHTVAVSGTGTVPAVTLTPAHLDFGSQVLNTTSFAQSFTLTNSGDAPLVITSMTLAGTHPTDYAFTGGNDPTTLAPNSSQTVTLTFTPLATGSRSASVSITDDATGSPHIVTLTGGGALAPTPAVSISPASLSFSAQPVGSTSAAKSFKLTNTGTAPLNISSISLQGSDAGDFAFAGGNGITTLAPGASQSIGLTFTPSAIGSRSAAVSIVDDAAGSPHTVSLSGTGSPVLAPGVWLSPTSLDFGDQLVNTTSAKLSITLTNSGNTTLHIGGVIVSGAEASDFTITAGSGAGTVAAGSSRTIRLTFTPGSTGSRGSTLAVASDAAGSPHTVSLVGNGVQPAITVTPVSLEFGAQTVGDRSAAQSLTLTNTGTAPLTITRASVSPGGDFSASGGGGTLAPGASQAISVSFVPVAVGERSAALTISSSAPGSPLSVALHGTGTAPAPPLPGVPALDFVPGGLTFNSQNVGSASGLQTVMIASVGTAPLVIRSISVGGVNPGDFTITAGGQAGTVAEGTRRSVSIRFTPTAAGSRGAALVVASSASGSPHRLPLAGTGIAIAPPPGGDWPQSAHDARQLGLADAAIDPRGLTPWSVPLGGRPGGSPVARGGVIYAGADIGVVAVDATTRTVRWTHALPAPVRSTPAVTENTVVVSAGGLFGLSPADGSVRWQRPDLAASDEVSPLLVGDTIFISVKAGNHAAAMVAVNAATGADLWRAPLPAGFDSRAAAAAYPEIGLLFVALAPLAAAPSRPIAGPSAVMALRLSDGGAGWSAPIFPASPPPVALSVGWVASTLALRAPQPAVFLAAGQRVMALSVATGLPLWSRALPETALVGPPVVSTAAPQGATLFVGGASGRIYALDSTTGADTTGGLASPTGPLTGPLGLAGTTLFAPTGSGLIAVDITRGTPIWTSSIPAASAAAVANGTLLVSATDGRLIGFSH